MANKVSFLDDRMVIISNPLPCHAVQSPFGPDPITCVISDSGSFSCSVDMIPKSYSGPGLMVVLEDQILDDLLFSEDFTGHVLVFSLDFLRTISVEDSISRFVEIRRNPFCTLDEKSLDTISSYVKLLHGVLDSSDRRNKESVAVLLAKAFCLDISSCLDSSHSDLKNSRQEDICFRFIDLVKGGCKEHRNIGYYADKLCITPKYLSSVVKSTSGKTASRWIEDFTIFSSKRLLSSGKYTVSQVSVMMNFQSQSDFGKYFKKIVGITPKAFQRTL